MRRIVILGNAGSGKSTLARRLGERLGIPVCHLDVLFWRPGWVEPDAQGFRDRVAEATAGEAWVSEGNYASRTFDIRLPRADTIIWMETSRQTCLRRVIWRTMFERRRSDLADGCSENILRGDFPEFLRFTWNFDRVSRPRIEHLLAQHADPGRIIRVARSADAEALLARARETAPP